MNKILKKLMALALMTFTIASAENAATPNDLPPTVVPQPFEILATKTSIPEITSISSPTNITTFEEKLNPNRTIEIYAAWEGKILYFGNEMTLTAVLKGYDNVVYTLQWQQSVDTINWVDIEGENNNCLHIIITEENYTNYWRIIVKIIDIIE